MIKVDPKLIALDHNQESFELKIYNLSLMKLYFRIKSSNINPIAPKLLFGSIEPMADKVIQVFILIKEGFEIKIAVESCQVDAREEMQFDDWRKLKIPKQTTVIKVMKPPNNTITLKPQISEKRQQLLELKQNHKSQFREITPLLQNIRTLISSQEDNTQSNLLKDTNRTPNESNLQLPPVMKEDSIKSKQQSIQLNNQRLIDWNLSQNINELKLRHVQPDSGMKSNVENRISLSYSTLVLGSILIFFFGCLFSHYI